MSANNQVIVAPFPEDLEKYAVWHDGCVDNPFDYSRKPYAIVELLEEAIEKGDQLSDEVMIVEYGMSITLRKDVLGYETKIWEEFPDYSYLGMIRVPSTHVV